MQPAQLVRIVPLKSLHIERRNRVLSAGVKATKDLILFKYTVKRSLLD